MTQSREDRFVGSLIGQCLGDALGFVVEGYGAEHCRRYVRDRLRAGRAGTAGRAPFPFGQYTDDSPLARELVLSYLACGAFDPADYAGRIAALFVEDRVVGRGRSTEAAGVPWQQAGTPGPMAGNGSAMRAGPIGLMFCDDAEALVRAAHDQGRITHADPRCSAGAAAIARAVALALQEGPIDPPAFVADLAACAETLEPRFAAEFARLSAWLELSPERAGPEIARAGRAPGFGEEAWDGITPFVVPSVLWSLYAFLRTPTDYWETVCTAIEVGGDVDTTAAMAGAISGAHNGIRALPEALARQVHDRGGWGFDDLARLARELYAAKTGRGSAARPSGAS